MSSVIKNKNFIKFNLHLGRVYNEALLQYMKYINMCTIFVFKNWNILVITKITFTLPLLYTYSTIVLQLINN